MYTCLIVDDQKEAVDLIIDHVNKTPQLIVKHAGTNPIDALGFLDKERVDIVFLDIEMPEITGLDFVETLKNKWGNNIPKIVFTTGFSKYALDGFEQGVVDYIMKPVSYKRFIKAVDRIIYDLNKRESKQETIDFIFADIEGEKIRIDYEDIFFIEGARNYIIIGTERKKYITYKTMRNIEELLPESKFLRVHKSFIVSTNKISSIRGNTILLNFRGERISMPIGLSYRKSILKKLRIG